MLAENLSWLGSLLSALATHILIIQQRSYMLQGSKLFRGEHTMPTEPGLAPLLGSQGAMWAARVSKAAGKYTGRQGRYKASK